MVHPTRVIPAHRQRAAEAEPDTAKKPKRVRGAKKKAKRVRKPKATAAAPRALVDQLKAKGS